MKKIFCLSVVCEAPSADYCKNMLSEKFDYKGCAFIKEGESSCMQVCYHTASKCADQIKHDSKGLCIYTDTICYRTSQECEHGQNHMEASACNPNPTVTKSQSGKMDVQGTVNTVSGKQESIPNLAAAQQKLQTYTQSNPVSDSSDMLKKVADQQATMEASIRMVETLISNASAALAKTHGNSTR